MAAGTILLVAVLRDARKRAPSASRFTAGAFGFLLLIQCGDRPDPSRESFRVDTLPSSPSLYNASPALPSPAVASLKGSCRHRCDEEGGRHGVYESKEI